MPINPSIPLAFDQAPPVRMPDPWAQQARAVELRDLLRRDELGRYQLEEARRQREQEQALREVFARHIDAEGRLNRTGVLADLYRINPDLAFTAQRNWLAHDKAVAEANEAKRKADAARVARLGSLAGSVTDQTSYRRAIDTAVSEGLLTREQAAGLPQVYDDATKEMLRQFQTEALTAAQQLEQARAQAEHQARLPGIEADAASKAFALAGQLAPGAAQTTTQWTTLRSALPERWRNLFPAVPYSGAVAEAERLAMTPEERAAAEDRRASRAEQERHNREIERIRGERETNRQAERLAKQSEETTKRLRTLKSEEQQLDREQARLDERRRELGRILETGKHPRPRQGRKAKDVEITPEERARFQAEYDTATEQWRRILDRRKEIEAERRHLLGQGAATATARPQQVPTAQVAGWPRQVDAATGRTVGGVTYTEQEFRRRARERGIVDVEQALAEARRSGLVR
jgi:hypothetical protein